MSSIAVSIFMCKCPIYLVDVSYILIHVIIIETVTTFSVSGTEVFGSVTGYTTHTSFDTVTFTIECKDADSSRCDSVIEAIKFSVTNTTCLSYTCTTPYLELIGSPSRQVQIFASKPNIAAGKTFTRVVTMYMITNKIGYRKTCPTRITGAILVIARLPKRLDLELSRWLYRRKSCQKLLR